MQRHLSIRKINKYIYNTINSSTGNVAAGFRLQAYLAIKLGLLSSCFKNKEDNLCTHRNLEGLGPGFDSKSEQLTSITIHTDPRQRTWGPVPIRLLMRSPEVPDTLYLARPADHGGNHSEGCFSKTPGRHTRSVKTFFKRSLRHGYRRD